MRLLAAAVCAMALQGCVSTTITTPEGLTVQRTAFWSDFAIKASRGADGALKIEETQNSQQAALVELLQALKVQQ